MVAIVESSTVAYESSSVIMTEQKSMKLAMTRLVVGIGMFLDVGWTRHSAWNASMPIPQI